MSGDTVQPRTEDEQVFGVSGGQEVRGNVTIISSAGVPGTVVRLPHEVTTFFLVTTNDLLTSTKKNGADAAAGPGPELEGLGQAVPWVGPQSAPTHPSSCEALSPLVRYPPVTQTHQRVPVEDSLGTGPRARELESVQL